MLTLKVRSFCSLRYNFFFIYVYFLSNIILDVASEAELEEAVHGGVFEVKTYHDLPDEAAERFLRDVEWM